MARDFFINGESMVTVKGAAGSLVASLVQLGLTTDPIQVTLNTLHEDLIVDAYGKNNPVDEQVFGGTAEIIMNLIDFDPLVLAECLRLSMGGTNGATLEGMLARAGTRMGGGLPLFNAGNNWISLNISSPVAGRPYNFPAARLANNPLRWPLGTEKSIVAVTWRAIAYTVDPWGGGTGSAGNLLYTRIPQT